MKCQILFSGKNKKNKIILSSAENAQRVVKVNDSKIYNGSLQKDWMIATVDNFKDVVPLLIGKLCAMGLLVSIEHSKQNFLSNNGWKII